MAHAYTPGLKVLHHSKVNKNRRLPIKGSVTKKVGDSICFLRAAKNLFCGTKYCVTHTVCKGV